MPTLIERVESVIPCGILRLFGATDGGRCAPHGARPPVDTSRYAGLSPIEKEKAMEVDNAKLNARVVSTPDAGVYRPPSDEQRSAFEFYDNLHDHPDTRISVQVDETRDGNKTGRKVNTTFTVRQLAMLGDGYETAQRELAAAVAESTTLGLSYQRPSDNDINRLLIPSSRQSNWTRDPVFADASRGILAYPSPLQAGRLPDPAYPGDPRLVPDWFPTVKNHNAILYATPRILDGRTITNEALENSYQRLWLAVWNHLKARNASPRFHPAVIAAMAPMVPDHNISQPDDWSDGRSLSGDIHQWETQNGDGRFWFRNSLYGVRLPDGDPNVGPTFTMHPFWRNSLNVRTPVTMTSGFSLTHGSLENDPDQRWTLNTTTADALLEYLRLANMAQFLLSTGLQEANGSSSNVYFVDMCAVSQTYIGVQRIGYNRLGIPVGANVAQARQAWRDDIQARKNKIRTRSLMVPGYESTGDTGADIAAATMAAIASGVAAGLASGNYIVGIVVAVVKGLSVMIAVLLEDEVPRDNSSDPLRFTIPPEAVSPPVYGLDNSAAFKVWPAFRYQRGR